jgi:hypothetical protein
VEDPAHQGTITGYTWPTSTRTGKRNWCVHQHLARRDRLSARRHVLAYKLDTGKWPDRRFGIDEQ